MPYEEILKSMKKSADPLKSLEMAAYMKNLFPFLGVQSPRRKQICRIYFKSLGEGVDFSFTDWCYENDSREFQYIAVDYLTSRKQFLNETHLKKIREYILAKSWWDTVDGLDRVAGYIAFGSKEAQNTLLEWSRDDNIWLRRAAIDHQLLRKEKTDRPLLEQILINNLNRKEFFINKAIGWSLRDFGKTDPEWVKGFIHRHRENMSPLSLREAAKYLNEPV